MNTVIRCGILSSVLACSLYTHTALAQPAPDLELSGLDTSAVVTDGQTLILGGQLGIDIDNIGPVDVVNPFVAIAFDDRNGNGAWDSGTDVLLGQVNLASGLLAGVP